MSDERCAKKPTKRFSKDWLSDKRFKDWIRQVPGNDSLFYCAFCDNTYSCGSSHVARHSESATHNKAFELNNNEETYKQKFLPKWLEIEPFKPWLKQIPDNP